MSKLRFLLALFVTGVFLSPLLSEAGPVRRFTFRGFWGSNLNCGVGFNETGIDNGSFSGICKGDGNSDDIPDNQTLINKVTVTPNNDNTPIEVVRLDIPVQRQRIEEIIICADEAPCDNTDGIDKAFLIGLNALSDPKKMARLILGPLNEARDKTLGRTPSDSQRYTIDFLGPSFDFEPRLLTLDLMDSLSKEVVLRYEFNLIDESAAVPDPGTPVPDPNTPVPEPGTLLLMGTGLLGLLAYVRRTRQQTR